MIIVSLQIVQFQCLKHLCPEKHSKATCLMCISLCLKTNVWVGDIYFSTNCICKSIIKRNSLSFCRYNKAFGVGIFFWDLSASVVRFTFYIPFSMGERNIINFTYGGIRALTIANLESSAYGLYTYFV